MRFRSSLFLLGALIFACGDRDGPSPRPATEIKSSLGRVARSKKGDSIVSLAERELPGLGAAAPSAIMWATQSASSESEDLGFSARTTRMHNPKTDQLVAGVPFVIPEFKTEAPFQKESETEKWLVGLSALELADRMEQGRLTSTQLAEAYLSRIDALNARGPRLKAIVALNEKALEQAAALDAERAQGKTRGRLHGVPIVIKDNIETKDGVSGATGSLALLERPSGRNADAVVALEKAGLLVLGVANLSEWSNFRSLQSASGYSARGGFTQAAYRLGGDPCGSSSGSAVAVAADLVPLSIGSETAGSLSCPAEANRVVTLKPSLGLISGRGVVPIALAFDTLGPMGHTVRDVAELFRALSQARGESASWQMEAELIPSSFDGKFGIAADASVGDPKLLTALAAKHSVVRGKELPSFDDFPGTFLGALAKRDLPAYLKERGAPSLYEIIDRHRALSEERIFDDLQLASLLSLSFDESQAREPKRPQHLLANDSNQETLRFLYETSQEWTHERASERLSTERQRIRAEMAALLDESESIALITAVSPVVQCAIGGLPYLTLPFYGAEGAHTTLYIVGRYSGDREVLLAAAAVEALSGAGAPPDFSFSPLEP